MDLIIIGAGPAGLAASIAAAKNGLRVLIVDEFMKPGGRLLGQLHEEKKNVWWNGIEEAHTLHTEAISLGVEIRLQTSVYHLEKQSSWCVHTTKGTFSSKALLLATGAIEKSFPIPGWTLPGVMSIGAAQVMTNVHHVKPGHKGVIIGINALSFAIARELILCGVDIAGFYLPPTNVFTKSDAQPRDVFKQMLRLAHLAPSPFFKIGGALARKSTFIQKQSLRYYPKNGFQVWGVPIHLKKAVTDIIGDSTVTAVSIASLTQEGEIIPGSETEQQVDFVAIAGGLTPLTELIGLTTCPLREIASLGGAVPEHAEDMTTPVPHLYVAGNITGIESAKVAKAQGHVAGLSVARHSFKKYVCTALQQAMAQVQTTRAQALIQFHPNVKNGRQQLYKLACEQT
ncbi:NAD(P)/FAD-dependent oxidoreductase [Shouchella lonarensis]|uniref:Sarcosine oxidase subunit alpha n=1 Tax=Shouchella lonarensis TaxID=1464122 RepID=A0A1G6JTG4_9BACI|nr:FAD-dependent oxidoreductase [Shouchella lonarensis]SDC21948.1 sarcosine oxidase subunit alpha [Shouchella lonarensis]